jgi:phosphoribosylformimino-5-aminoimidazole carboxamide ribotide isomerase
MSHSFQIYPAIDLRHGQVVRLQEGDPARQTNYDPDPAAAARRWLSAGAAWLHVVNLDGAFGESGAANREALAAVLRTAGEFDTPVQFGGGLRTLEALEQVLEMGVRRVVIGTAAVEQPELVDAALQRWGPQRIAVGLDARGGWVQVRGWQQGTGVPAVDLAIRLAKSGLNWLIFTDIARDGLQTGLNIAATADLAHQSGLQVIASGGVGGWEDIHAACDAGLPGAIVGKALYEGKFVPQELFRHPCESCSSEIEK